MTMTLQRRLIVAVLIAAPLAWLVTLAAMYWRTTHEINELYDTEMVRLAQQVRALLPRLVNGVPALSPPLAALPGDAGDAGLGDLAVAVWQADGTPLPVDPDGEGLPRRPGHEGFDEGRLGNEAWRLYYLDEPLTGARVAVGQRVGERDELIVAYIAGQALPWLIGLPLLIGLLIAAVRRALRPVLAVSATLENRRPDDPTPLPFSDAPGELRPLIEAMNGLITRVAQAIEHERRLTADAAHELRTPLAALHAHWEVARRSADSAERSEAMDNVERGIQRLERLVSQLLTMARLENAQQPSFADVVDWRLVAQQAVEDCLWLAERKDVDIVLEWPAGGALALPVVGDPASLCILLRNLLDNAIRYSPAGSAVQILFEAHRITVQDAGPGVSPQERHRLGDRFYRAPGQAQPGSGLGLSIAAHVARQHGLSLQFESGAPPGPTGLRVSLTRHSDTVPA